ncbi:MAG: Mrp/NBP35 family ATP-binding protein [Gemmatimonadetes bacterium]|nr:Mrp/NBP35 family ATP-binding protein [Gemmatimonadota bacterium]
MNQADLTAAVASALSKVHNPRLGNDILSTGMVKDLTIDAATGTVAFTVLLTRQDPGTVVIQARKAVRAIGGVKEVKIEIVDPAGAPAHSHQPPADTVPMNAGPAPLAHLGKIIAVSSGKGGVGKSTVAANLAIALAQAGHRVGLMDADIYGPNIPRMFGVFEKPPVINSRIQPLEAHGIKLISLGLLVDRDAPVIWRGPIIMKVLTQFLNDVEWGELDFFVVDLPPGTGDAQLSLAQSTRIAGAVIVTTPQEVAVGDALRGAKMFEKVQVPVIGVVENMSGFTTPNGERIELFGSGGGQRLAAELRVPLLGQVPLQPGIAEAGDVGKPALIAVPDSPAAKALRAIAERVVSLIAPTAAISLTN